MEANHRFLKKIETSLKKLIAGKLTISFTKAEEKEYPELIHTLINFRDHIQQTVEGIERVSKGSITSIPSMGNRVFSSPFKQLVESLQSITTQAERIANGDYSEDVQLRSEDDNLLKNLQNITFTLSEASFVAEQVADGNLDIFIDVKGETDYLGKSMNRMIERIHHATKENENQIWLSKSQSELSEVMRGQLELRKLGKQIIRCLVERFQATSGLIYLYTENELRLLSSINYRFRKRRAHQISLNEGLVGQAAYEESTIVLEGVKPSDKLISRSENEYALVVPIIYNDVLHGVVHIASENPFTEAMVFFLENSCENISIAISASIAQKERSELLELSKKQTALLEKQTADLQKQTKDMKKQQKQLSKANKLLKKQTGELRANEHRLEENQQKLELVNEELKDKTNYLEEQKKAIERKNDFLQMAHKQLDEKAKELTLASKYKSEFLANMSHELRTPLNSMLLLSKKLVKNKEGNLTQKQIDIATIIHNGGTELLHLINDILDLSKVESGKMSIYADYFEIATVQKNIETLFEPMLKEKQIPLRIQISDTVPKEWCTDQQKLEQILRNLISNALKFTESGHIHVEVFMYSDASEINIEDADYKDFVALSVSDTGIGIPEHKQQRIFEAFEQMNQKTSKKYGGTGLGLSICNSFARMLGGYITLHSVQNEGSTFTVVVRHTLEQSEDKAEPLPNEPDIHKEIVPKSVIHIESDLHTQELTACVFEKVGIPYTSISDEAMALKCIQNHAPIALIIDLEENSTSRWAFLKQIKSHHIFSKIPVFATSKGNIVTKAETYGIEGVLKKPLNEESLTFFTEQIQAVLSEKGNQLLFIDDNTTLTQLLSESIDALGFDVTIAPTGNQALEILKKRMFDCVVLDLMLPDISGFEVLEILINQEEYYLPPIIVFSSKELTDKEVAILKQYCTEIIKKDTNGQEKLLETITHIFKPFSNLLPAETEHDHEEDLETDTSLENKKILIVDDNMRNLFALNEILEEYNCEIIKAVDGRNALEILSEETGIDLILMDIMMPEMDGYEASRKIRETDRETPIIAVSAHIDEEAQTKTHDAGMNDWLAKPVAAEELIKMLKKWL